MTPQLTRGAIVVVEDSFISSFLRNILERKGYPVIPMNAGDGVELLRTGDREISLVITNTPAVFSEFADRVPLLYLSGCPDPAAVSPFRSSRVLSKPFHTEQLLACVEQLLMPM